MLIRRTVYRTAFTAGLLALAVAGCGQMRPSQKIDIYEATLTGSQEVPPVNTPATGMAEVQLNTHTNTLTWKVTYSGLTSAPVGGHIHGPAGAGVNAPVAIPFAGNLAAQPIQGRANVTPQHIADLVAGRWYVNIHSANFPGGEIRGQLHRRE